MNYYVARNGQTYGPYSEETIRKYLTEGSMLATDLGHTDSMPNWAPLGQILGPSASAAAAGASDPGTVRLRCGCGCFGSASGVYSAGVHCAVGLQCSAAAGILSAGLCPAGLWRRRSQCSAIASLGHHPSDCLLHKRPVHYDLGVHSGQLG